MTNSTKPVLDAAEHLRFEFVRRPRCPACQSSNIQTIRSSDQGDGTTKRHTQCRDCQHRFFVIVE